MRKERCVGTPDKHVTVYGQSIRHLFKQWVSKITSCSTRLGCYVLAIPTWVKLSLTIGIISVVSFILDHTNFFVISRTLTIAVLTLQTAFAAYLLSISKSEHTERLIPIIQDIFSIVDATDDSITAIHDNIHEMAAYFSSLTLDFPQRLGVYTLMGDLFLSPLLLLNSQYLLTWIMLAMFLNTVSLIVGLGFLRLELFKTPLKALVSRLTDQFSKHPVLMIFVLIILGWIVWLKIKPFTRSNKDSQSLSVHK